MIWLTYIVGTLVCLNAGFKAGTFGGAVVAALFAALQLAIGGGLMVLALALHTGVLAP